MSIEDNDLNLEQAFLSLHRLAKRTDERHDSVSESINLLKEMIERHDERFKRTEAKQPNAYTRLAALVDAQIRTEEALRQTDVRLNKLLDAFEQHIREGH